MSHFTLNVARIKLKYWNKILCYLHGLSGDARLRASIWHSTPWQCGSRRPLQAGEHTGQPHCKQQWVKPAAGERRHPRHTGVGSTILGPTTVGFSSYSMAPAVTSRVATRYRPSSLLTRTFKLAPLERHREYFALHTLKSSLKVIIALNID